MRQLITCLAAVALPACFADSSIVRPDQRAAAQCAAERLETVLDVFEGVALFVAGIGDALPPGATYDPLTGDYTVATPLGTVEGVVTSTDDIGDGIDVGERVTATWLLDGVSVTGSGLYHVERTAAGIFAATGGGPIEDAACGLSMANLDISFDISAPRRPTGTLFYTGGTPREEFVGEMTFDGTEIVQSWMITSIEDYGIQFPFWIDLLTSEVTLGTP